jgi:hypothetical protein
VDLLHIALIKADTNVSFLLTLKIEGVQTQSFFDTALKLKLVSAALELQARSLCGVARRKAERVT